MLLFLFFGCCRLLFPFASFSVACALLIAVSDSAALVVASSAAAAIALVPLYRLYGSWLLPLLRWLRLRLAFVVASFACCCGGWLRLLYSCISCCCYRV
jgi:hypothetical protein